MTCFYKFIIFIILYFSINTNNVLVSAQLPPGYCPSPLIYRNTTDRNYDIDNGFSFIGDTNCVQPCPSLIFTENHWNNVFNMSLVAGTVNMFACIFLIITYSPLVNKVHTRHTVGILFLFTGILLIMTTDGRQLWDIDDGFGKYCYDGGARYARSSDTKCLTTAIFFQFGCVTAIIWWAALAVDIWVTIKKIKVTKKIFIGYVVILNILALFLTFGPIRNYGYAQTAIGCWMVDLKYQVGFFWAPVGACLLIGSICICLILYEIYNVSDAVKKRLLGKHLKPLLLAILMLVEFFYMFIFYSYVTSNKNNYEEIVGEYVVCLFINAANPSVCKVGKTVSPSAQFFFHFCIRLMGVEGLAFFGFTKQFKRIWLSSFWLNNDFIRKWVPSLSSSENSTGSKSSHHTTTNTNADQSHFGIEFDQSGEVELSGIDSIDK